MEGRTVIAKLLILAQDPQNQTFVVKDEGCMTGLVSSLVHIDPEVVMVAARTLQFLSGHPQNKKPMREFPNLVDNLIAACTNAKSAKTKEFATETLENIGVSMTDSNQAGGAGVVSYDSLNESENAMPNFVRFNYQKVTVYVDGLDDNSTCILARRVLINVPGVISVAFDRQHGTASVGTRETNVDSLIQRLCEALNRAGVVGSSKPISKEIDENDDVNREYQGTQDSKIYQDEDSGYLDEADYYGEKESAVTKYGCSSLEARLAQQRRDEELHAEQTGRILSKVGSVLSNAGSWLMGW